MGAIVGMKVFWSALMLVLLFAGAAGAEVATVSESDVYSDILEFVVSRDPVLEAQRQVMEAARALDTISADDEIPGYAQSSLLRMKFDAVRDVQSAQNTYTQLERQLVSSVFNNLTRIFALRNQIENNRELLVLLESRLGSTERQAEAGIIAADKLWDLNERIISVQISIADGESQLRALERETAYNYGGGQWETLLQMIQKVQ